MTCPRCGTRNKEGALYCRSCRSPLPRPNRAAARRRGGSVVGTVAAVVILLGLFAGGGYLLGQHTFLQATPPVVATDTPIATDTPGAAATATASSPRGGAPATATPRPRATAAASVTAAAHGRPTATPVATATAHGHPTATPVATATARPTVTTLVATATAAAPGGANQAAAIGAAVVGSNDAWIAAMEHASPAGLATIKTAGSLRATLATVAHLRATGEYYRIRPGQFEVLWTHVLSPTHAHALARKTGEYRALYRTGQAQPLATTTDSSTSLYDLVLVGGHWLVAQVINGDLALGEHPDATPAPTTPVAPSPTSGVTSTPGVTTTTTARATTTATPVAATSTHGVTIITADAPPSGQAAPPSTATFSSSAPKIYCVATLAHVAAGDTISFVWHDRGAHKVLYTYDAPAAAADAPNGATKWAYLVGPLPSGQYSCQVVVNSTSVGTAPFEVR